MTVCPIPAVQQGVAGVACDAVQVGEGVDGAGVAVTELDVHGEGRATELVDADELGGDPGVGCVECCLGEDVGEGDGALQRVGRGHGDGAHRATASVRTCAMSFAP
jgi:hypothetical protein